MPSSSSDSLVIDHFEWLTEKSLQGLTRGWRWPVIISGAESWCWSVVSTYLTQFDHNVILAKQPPETINGRTLKTDKPNTLLGFESDNVVFNAFDGFNPDALSAISGTLKPGGFLFILCPDLKDWPTSHDDYARSRTSYGVVPPFTSQRLIKRVLNLSHELQVPVFQQHTSLALSNPKLDSPNPQPNQYSWGVKSNTEEQENVLKLVCEQLMPLQGKRLCVLTADRGRGKSHLLGLTYQALSKAAASETNLKIDNGINYYITAPNKAASVATFNAIDACQSQNELLFIPPEEVLDRVSENDVLMVDEAASLPIPLLIQWSHKFNRIIFSTTTHGYEGTGKGFQVRFLSHLEELSKDANYSDTHVSQFELTHPIRFAGNDPLEAWTFKAFCLDSEPQGLNYQNTDFATFENQYLDRQVLSDSPEMLEALFSLLVQAHYQTRPSDLRDILDAPGVHIFIRVGILKGNPQAIPIAACLCFDEGNSSGWNPEPESDIDSEDMANLIFKGERRPRGHLTPQVLTLHMGKKDALELKSARVVRIATLPNFKNQMHGSELLGFCKKHFLNNQYDYLSSSFADTKDVRHFWNKNEFELIRTGSKLDQASGTQSSLVILGLSDTGKALQKSCKQFYENTLLMKENYSALSTTQKALVDIFISHTGSYEAIKGILSHCKSWSHFYIEATYPKKAKQPFRDLVKKWRDNEG